MIFSLVGCSVSLSVSVLMRIDVLLRCATSERYALIASTSLMQPLRGLIGYPFIPMSNACIVGICDFINGQLVCCGRIYEGCFEGIKP